MWRAAAVAVCCFVLALAGGSERATPFLLHGGSNLAPCGPDPAPAPAAAHGYTCETFVDNFTSLSTIDTTNTRAPGFKWYTNNAWPSPQGGGSSIWNTMPNTLSDSYSITGSGLVINVPFAENNRVYAGSGAMLTTCASNGTPGYVGTTFTNGWYADVDATSVSDPAFSEYVSWYYVTEFFTSTATTPADGTPLTEIDNAGTTSHTAIIEWTHNGGQDFAEQYVTSWEGAADYGTLVVPATQNAGTAIVSFYRNDVLRSATGPWPTPGVVSTVGTQHHCIILQSNYNNIATIRSVKVWQLPP